MIAIKGSNYNYGQDLMAISSDHIPLILSGFLEPCGVEMLLDNDIDNIDWSFAYRTVRL